MIVETIPELNILLNACGCCPMPVGTAPRLEYQSTLGEYNSELDAEASNGALYTDGTITVVYANCTDNLTYSYNYLLNGSTCSYELAAPIYTVSAESCDPATRGALVSITKTGITAYTPIIFTTEAVNNFNANKDFSDPACVATGGSAYQFSRVNVTQATFGESYYSLDIINARFRVGVPLDYSTTPLPKTFYEVTWDYIAALKTWWNWHDGGRVGPAPAGGVILVTPDSWQWGGSMSTQFSSWRDLPLDAEPTSTETRVANMRYTHFRSTRFGSLPVETGPQVLTA
jgi:hypothetical protein